MDIQELRMRRGLLERELFGLIEPLLGRFRTETGVSIAWVSVDLADTIKMGERETEHMLVAVRCGVDI
jgi:ABC-type tungstate transport system permease subunit